MNSTLEAIEWNWTDPPPEVRSSHVSASVVPLKRKTLSTFAKKIIEKVHTMVDPSTLGLSLPQKLSRDDCGPDEQYHVYKSLAEASTPSLYLCTDTVRGKARHAAPADIMILVVSSFSEATAIDSSLTDLAHFLLCSHRQLFILRVWEYGSDRTAMNEAVDALRRQLLQGVSPGAATPPPSDEWVPVVNNLFVNETSENGFVAAVWSLIRDSLSGVQARRQKVDVPLRTPPARFGCRLVVTGLIRSEKIVIARVMSGIAAVGQPLSHGVHHAVQSRITSIGVWGDGDHPISKGADCFGPGAQVWLRMQHGALVRHRIHVGSVLGSGFDSRSLVSFPRSVMRMCLSFAHQVVLAKGAVVSLSTVDGTVKAHVEAGTDDLSFAKCVNPAVGNGTGEGPFYALVAPLEPISTPSNASWRVLVETAPGLAPSFGKCIDCHGFGDAFEALCRATCHPTTTQSSTTDNSSSSVHDAPMVSNLMALLQRRTLVTSLECCFGDATVAPTDSSISADLMFQQWGHGAAPPPPISMESKKEREAWDPAPQTTLNQLVACLCKTQPVAIGAAMDHSVAHTSIRIWKSDKQPIRVSFKEAVPELAKLNPSVIPDAALEFLGKELLQQLVNTPNSHPKIKCLLSRGRSTGKCPLHVNDELVFAFFSAPPPSVVGSLQAGGSSAFFAMARKSNCAPNALLLLDYPRERNHVKVRLGTFLQRLEQHVDLGPLSQMGKTLPFVKDMPVPHALACFELFRAVSRRRSIPFHVVDRIFEFVFPYEPAKVVFLKVR